MRVRAGYITGQDIARIARRQQPLPSPPPLGMHRANVESNVCDDRGNPGRNRKIDRFLRRGRVADELAHSCGVRSRRVREDRPSPAREGFLYVLGAE
jgi:hypothetical protein